MAKHSNRVIIAGPGSASTVPIFPWWLKRVLKKREKHVADGLRKAAKSINAVYANALEETRLTKNLGKDRLHLNAKGDKILDEFIWSKVQERGWFKSL